MALLSLQGVTLNLGGKTLLDTVDLHVEQGERVCLVGRNGVGKSSLMALLSGDLTPDGGTIVRTPGVTFGHMPQAVPDHWSGPVFGVVASGLGKEGEALAAAHLIATGREDQLSAAKLALARDLFIFSYCTRGMSFVDMAFLRKRDLSGGEINYVRRKTGQLMTVHLETCMREIVRRYEWRTRNTPYVFPLLTAEEPGRAYSQYQIALNYYNRQLKRLSQLLGLEEGLSSYASRHSWATAARNHRVPITVISAGMGHTSERTTRIYLSSLESSVIDCANRKILSALTRI